MLTKSIEQKGALGRVLVHPTAQAPSPQSRLARDLDRSLHAENIARELAPAVHRKPWHDLESWQQEDLRGAAQTLVRSFDLTAQAVAKMHAVDAFFASLGVLDGLGTRAKVGGAFLVALQSYQLHLSVGACEDRPTASEDAAYAKGIQGSER